MTETIFKVTDDEAVIPLRTPIKAKTPLSILRAAADSTE